jgi:dolichol kinase
MKSEKKNSFNFVRKAWHLLGLFIPLALYLDWYKDTFQFEYATRAIIVIVLVVSLVLLIITEVLRFKSESFSIFFWKVLGPLMKDGERQYMNATLPYFTANLFVIYLFPAEIAVLSLAFLVIGDPFAAYIGANYGKNRFYNGKSLEGIIAFIVSATIFGLFLTWGFSFYNPDSIYSMFDPMGEFQFSSLIVLIIGAIIAGITEFFSSTTWKGFLDDNLLIPVISSLAMVLVSNTLFGKSWNEIVFPIMDLLQKQ